MSTPHYILNDLTAKEQNLFREIVENHLNDNIITKNDIIKKYSSKILNSLIKKELIFIDTKNDAVYLTQSGIETASFEILI